MYMYSITVALLMWTLLGHSYINVCLIMKGVSIHKMNSIRVGVAVETPNLKAAVC